MCHHESLLFEKYKALCLLKQTLQMSQFIYFSSMGSYLLFSHISIALFLRDISWNRYLFICCTQKHILFAAWTQGYYEIHSVLFPIYDSYKA
jgi:hypothetical protein